VRHYVVVATARSFVAEVRDKVFAHFHAVKRHSSLQNCLFGLPGWILCEQSPWVKENDENALDFALQQPRLFRLVSTRVSVAFFRDLHEIGCCSFVGFIAKSHQARFKTIASCYYDCCTDGSASPGNHGYPQSPPSVTWGHTMPLWQGTNPLKTCSVILREEHGRRVFEKMVLRSDRRS
jgi:hypothetical protein